MKIFIIIFLLLSILNFSFGQTNYKLALVWGPVAFLAISLRVGKRGKPENYLVHLVKFNIQPKYLSAFQDPKNTTSPPKFKGNRL